MKKILILLVMMISIVLLTACNKKKDYSGDNINTPFIEISPNLQKKVEEAFHTKEISIGYSYIGLQHPNYSIDERKKYNTINWQENKTVKNEENYHFWFTCYYEKNGMVVFHVERTLKGLEAWAQHSSDLEYDINEYKFKIYGRTLQNYTYILVYKNDKLYELGYAYDNSIIDDNDVKEIYKHYIDSKFLKLDWDYNEYKYDPESIPSE